MDPLSAGQGVVLGMKKKKSWNMLKSVYDLAANGGKSIL